MKVKEKNQVRNDKNNNNKGKVDESSKKAMRRVCNNI